MIKVINKKYRKQEYNIKPISKKEETVTPLITTVLPVRETPVMEVKKEKTAKKVNNTTEKKE